MKDNHTRSTRLIFPCSILILTSLLILGAPVSGRADDSTIGSGAILSSGFGARALGMGGAYVAIADDYSAPYWNPAGTTRSNSIYLGGMRYDKFGLGLNMDYLSGGLSFSSGNPDSRSLLPSLNLPVVKGISFAGSYLGFSTEVRAIGPGGSEIPINYGERSFMGTAGIEFPVIGTIGVTGKNYRYSAPNAGVDGKDASASGFGFDLGYLVEPIEGLTFGLAAFDVTGTDVKWKNTPTEPTDTVQSRYSAGAAYRVGLEAPVISDLLTGSLTTSGQYSFGPGESNKVRLGLEYSASLFSLRAGAVRPEDRDVYFTAGAGIQVQFLTADLAWVQNNSLQGENTTDTIVFSTEFQF
jgi:hypothetical protein